MKPATLLVLFTLAFALACTNDATTKSEGVDTATVESDVAQHSPEAQLVQTVFPNMYQILKGQDEDFDPALFEETEGGYNTPPPPSFFAPEELEPFKAYLIYNSDSTKAIDLVSYNYIIDQKNGQQVLADAGPDTEVGIINLKDNMRTRIFYSGPGTLVREGKWLDSTTVMLGGAEEVSSTAIKPFLLRINLKEKSLQRFTYSDSVQAKL